MLASDVNAYIHRRVAGVYEFDITATLADDTTADKLMAAMTEYTAQFSKVQMSDIVLARLKKRFADSWRESLDNAEQITSRLAGWLARDLPYDELAKLPERMEAVELKDIRVQMQAISGEGRVVFAVLKPDTSALVSEEKPKKDVK